MQWQYASVNHRESPLTMTNRKELLILGAAVASATAGMYFYTDRKRDWNEPLGLKDRNDQPQKEIALSDSVIEKEVLDASAAMDLSESHDEDDEFAGQEAAPLSADNKLVKEPKAPTWSKHHKLGETVIEKKVLDASAAMDTPAIGLSESHDGNEAHEFYEKFLK